MDGDRFDSLARAFGAGRSRRRLLKTLGAAVLGAGGLERLGSAEAASCKKPNTRCGHKPVSCCPAPANGTATCTHGGCGIACNAGFTPCNGACVDTSADANNCGGCGQVCPSGSCVSGVCAAGSAITCPAGSQCESQCPSSTNPYCYCGTAIDRTSTCYLAQNGCTGATCASSAECGAGSVCVNLNGGCGGCDTFTGGTLGICNPICTS